jgi:hypothetical protein
VGEGDRLVEQLLTGPYDDEAATALLKEISNGYPKAVLGRLVRSDNPDAVKAAAWILAEAVPLAPEQLVDVLVLLASPIRFARYFGLQAAQASVSDLDGAVTEAAIPLVDDPERTVRWGALKFLSRTPTAFLRRALPRITDPTLAERVSWLIERTVARGPASDIESALTSADRRERFFAVAAAARVALTDPAPLNVATTSADDEVRSFAADYHVDRRFDISG